MLDISTGNFWQQAIRVPETFFDYGIDLDRHVDLSRWIIHPSYPSIYHPSVRLPDRPNVDRAKSMSMSRTDLPPFPDDLPPSCI